MGIAISSTFIGYQADRRDDCDMLGSSVAASGSFEDLLLYLLILVLQNGIQVRERIRKSLRPGHHTGGFFEKTRFKLSDEYIEAPKFHIFALTDN